MENSIKQGDIVKALTGRDKDRYFLVVFLKDDRAFITDGKTRKVNNLKKKNIKHIKKVLSESLKGLAVKIQSGQTVSNKNIYLSIKTQTQKIQED
mgnify:CR=1 FL=1